MDAGSLTRFLFKPKEQVARELAALPENQRVESVRGMLQLSRSTYELAKLVMPELGLDERMDLLELACRRDPRFASQLSARKIERPLERRGAVMSPETLAALKELGVARESYADLLRAEPVVCAVPTRSGNEINGFLMLKEDCLASGIVMIHEPGDGLAAFMDFRRRTFDLARALGKPEVELIGAAITNQRLGQMLVRMGFELATVNVPQAFGGGEMEILSKRFPVRP